jgi:hypothetical protein
MSTPLVNPMLEPFLAAAEAVAEQRPEVDPDLARELFEEAATLLHNGLALDGLDEDDTEVVVRALCVDLSARDPGVAVRARAEAAQDASHTLHDPDGARAAYLNALRILQI